MKRKRTKKGRDGKGVANQHLVNMLCKECDQLITVHLKKDSKNYRCPYCNGAKERMQIRAAEKRTQRLAIKSKREQEELNKLNELNKSIGNTGKGHTN